MANCASQNDCWKSSLQVRRARGAVLTDHVLADLQRLNVELDWIVFPILVGQCYDGAGNMRGKFSGMQHTFKRAARKQYTFGAMLTG